MLIIVIVTVPHEVYTCSSTNSTNSTLLENTGFL